MPVILSAQEAEVERPWSEANPHKSERSFLKNKLKAKQDCGSSGRALA
jgi:hypothetical protein